MPRPGPRRPLIAIRVNEDRLAYIDQMAVEEGIVRGDGEPNRSEMIRKLLSEAVQARMLKGWRPKQQ